MIDGLDDFKGLCTCSILKALARFLYVEHDDITAIHVHKSPRSMTYTIPERVYGLGPVALLPMGRS